MTAAPRMTPERLRTIAQGADLAAFDENTSRFDEAIAALREAADFIESALAAPPEAGGDTELQRLRDLKDHAIDVLTGVLAELRIVRDSTKGSLFEQVAHELRAASAPTRGDAPRVEEVEAACRRWSRPRAGEESLREAMLAILTDFMNTRSGHAPPVEGQK